MASTVSVPNESVGTKTRPTGDGRQITYRLSVVQQPERARACGQGAKSSTDRRPVDPPPIVELRIFEGEEGRESDITFSHKANFFLFATLENARTIAHGRVSQSQPTNVILTGSSVAGMSYLDRPKPAGYFIFPDLSVRHEGTYRLAFTLFEELKDPRDIDPGDRDSVATRPGQDHVSGRAEVRTLPFTVYSAKKFPGLAESTALSRMVADQGCRVRIRRDVRMRRRETKSGKDFDDYDDGDARERDDSPVGYGRKAVSGRDQPLERPRQLEPPSGTPSNVPQPRHSSSQEFNPQYHTPYGAPNQPTQQGFSQPVPYDAGSMAPYQYPPQPPQYNQPMVQAVPHMAQYQPQYQYHPGMMQYPQQTFTGNTGYIPQQMQSPAYEQPVSGMRQDNLQFMQPGMGQAQRNPPSHHYHPQQQAGPLGPMENGYRSPPPFQQQPMYSRHNSNHSTSGPASANGKDLPPIQTQTQTPQAHHTPTAITSPTSAGLRERSASYTYLNASRPPPPPPPQYVTESAGASRKRSYGATFDTQHVDQPLRNGQRPNTAGTDSKDPSWNALADTSSSSDDDQFEMEQLKMRYRRADGTEVVRGWPPL